MKKVIMVSLFALVTMVSFGQKVITSKSVTKKTPTAITIPLKDGMDIERNVTFKIVEPSKFDSIYNETSLDAIRDILLIANLQLSFEMKNRTSYKPLITPINKIQLVEYNGKTEVAVTIVAEAQNGYGNKISKEYHCYLNLDGLGFNVSSF